MAVKFKLTKSTLCLSSQSLEKFIKTQKNLSKPPPTLWSDRHDDELTTLTDPYNLGVRMLTLNHPVLRTLESSSVSLKQFNQIHTQLIVSNLFQHPLASSRVVKKLCSSPSTVSHAIALFDQLKEPDAFVCNTIVRSLVNWSDPHGAFAFYCHQMVGRFVLPNHYTFPILAKVCAEIGSVQEGEKIHARIVKFGFELDLFVRNALIHIWNSMIAGYVAVGDMGEAKELFEKMPFRDVISWNSLIDGYARIGNVSAAREYFDQMPFRNVVSWNTMLALYARSKDYSECLRLFDRMMEGGDAKLNEATLVSVLTACAHLGRLDREMFDGMPNKNVVSWNSMIMGYGMLGHGEKALEMFMEMEKRGLLPNDATFICILSVCAHAGMVLEGWWYFDLMRHVYMIEPKVEHYGCMVDLLGRAGLMKDSEVLIKKMPMEAGPALWGALLSACRSHSNLELGEIVAKRLIELKPGDIGPYVLLSNIYAAEGRWDDVENVRKMMTNRGLQKVVGSSLIELGDFRGEFCQGSDSDHKRSMLYSMLSEMGAQMKLL
ncbi:Pentatricopeptide repeat-containing protein [Camellia lanceoleosa]|uniref:Pentatricopeptide repeat-containing protein n=1 Tax=Camellia lanceoleosa TaxID=1840588 RepID=A0ACC0G2T8_9ERIC|nr:Pentatricopeptide repeat-containing protein [Camellia lanceoleosa]